MASRYYLYKPILLTESGCEYWASLAYWDLIETVELSLGYDPRGANEENTEYDEAAEKCTEFNDRHNILSRAIDIDDIKNKIHIPREEGEYLIAFTPYAATKWAVDNFPSFPQELLNAVMQRHNKTRPEKDGGKPNINLPDFHNYSRLNQITLKEATYLIASAQLTDINISSETEYKYLLEKEKRDVTRVLLNSVEADELEYSHSLTGCYANLDQQGSFCYDLNLMFVTMIDLCAWAMSKTYHLPPELLSLVSNHPANNQHQQKSKRPQPVDIASDHAAMCNVSTFDSHDQIELPINAVPPSRERTSEITREPEDNNLNGNQGSDALWARRDAIVAKASIFMQELVDKCHCLCRHDKLARIAYHIGNNGGSFKEQDRKNYALLKHFKAAALKIVPDERQFGNDFDPENRKNPNPKKSKLFNSDACKCEISDHKNFKPQK